MRYNHFDIKHKLRILQNQWERARQESAAAHPGIDHDYIGRFQTYLYHQLGEDWLALVATWLQVTPEVASLLLSVVDYPVRRPHWKTHIPKNSTVQSVMGLPPKTNPNP